MHYLLLLLLACACSLTATAQVVPGTQDSSFFLAHKKGLLGKLGRAISVNTPEQVLTADDGVVKNEAAFAPYKGKAIRQIRVEKLGFNTSVNDPQKARGRFLNDLNDALYTGTTNRTILRNLFFVPGDTLYPNLMADNEKFLRELTYLQDARIMAAPVAGDTSAVDITVLWKDLFPIGGSAQIGSATNMSLELNDDNLWGLGDRIQFRSIYDADRAPAFGTGIEYRKRNIRGSFLNLAIGYQNEAAAFNSGRREEKTFYLRGDLPLVSPYHVWTGAFETAVHFTRNGYIGDSIYNTDFKYKYRVLDGWMGYNIGGRKQLERNFRSRLKQFAALRGIYRKFGDVPELFKTTYHINYSDLVSVLASFTIFEQDYYHTNFLYGFGRNEDVPEGFSLALTGGWAQRNRVSRPYIGFDYQRNYFSGRKNYYNYMFRFGSFFNNDRMEDISMLAGLEYFTRLRRVGSSEWFTRHFLSGSITQQVRTVLNEPLHLASIFGIPELTIANNRASTRVSANCESVFYNTHKTFGFSFAPFVFTNISYLKAIGGNLIKGDIYSALGGGIRTRNENLVFGTMELKAYYYPRTTGRMTPWNITFNTGLRFKYNSQLIKRPDFALVN